VAQYANGGSGRIV